MPDRDGRRVVVTGLGAVSSLGIGARQFIAALRAGRSGIGPIGQFDATGFEHVLAGEVRDFTPSAHLHRVSPEEWGRSSQFAAAAARMAVEDAGVGEQTLSSVRTASCFGTTNGESQVLEDLGEQWVSQGPDRLDARLIGQVDAGRISAAVNVELGLSGEALTLGTACAAGNYSVGYAYDLIRSGEVDLALCGGADASNRHTHAGFHRLGALAADVPRPFDEHRDGIVTAEGGAALLLEPLEAALERGARIYAEVLGYGMSCDAHHMTNPHAPSIAECIRRAHRNAGIKPEDVDYICAHGTGTEANDSTEIAAVRDAFDGRVPPISSIKSALGHTMGAAAAFGALVSCAALHEGFLPASTTVRTVDPALGPDVDCVPRTSRAQRPRVVENHGFAFGGNNAVTIFGDIAA
ncbi:MULTISPECIES: beta-ketoacyl-[acyl-carrier-protein] synthase family protein [Streptomyces]|uniref:beta-ketoacyl-[acyl-carrier-protein] synthase family protein n=1 Tax=Streptomyces TaxID=1883 RepID=UPI00166F6F5B|nr:MULTISPECIES: beta-ketoacyl-[acyl-carrier-protein] synthase family protein [Streptomyces]UFR05205.1 beta-ketoacyl-[acyl-carrier-protein] synthase family protein [Streptomyces sp. Go40/10]GGT03863.1 3-oxoacyl-ACP synthase [Streptomyces cinerochromogenes]